MSRDPQGTENVQRVVLSLKEGWLLGQVGSPEWPCSDASTASPSKGLHCSMLGLHEAQVQQNLVMLWSNTVTVQCSCVCKPH